MATVTGWYVPEIDEGGVRYRRATADPVGAAGPVVAAAEPTSPFDPLGAPDPFPLAWLERPPGWLSAGEGVRVVLHGEETGRAAGYIRLHDTCYQDGTSACRVPPPVSYDAFYRGKAEVVDDDGQVREVAVGAVCVVGGHSTRAGAKTHTEAIEHMDTPEKWKLRGVLVEDEIGLLFLGAARADMTRAEAALVNQSDTSGEWWPIFEKENGQVSLVGHDLIGIALVAGGAFRKTVPERFRVLAAALGRDELDPDEMEAMMTETGCSCGGHPAVLEAAVGDAGAAVAAVLVDEQVSQPDELPSSDGVTHDGSHGPVGPSDGEALAALRVAFDDLQRVTEKQQADIDRLQRDVTRLLVQQMTEEEIVLPERMDTVEAVARAIDARLAAIEARQTSGVVDQQPAAPPQPVG